MSEFIAKLLNTLITVVVAVGVSGAIWVVANVLVNRLRDTSVRATVAARGVMGFLIAALLSGNRLTRYSTVSDEAGLVRSFVQWAWLPIAAAVTLVIISEFAERQPSVARRTTAYVPGCAALAVFLASMLEASTYPNIDVPAAITAPLIAAATFIASSWRGGRTRTLSHIAYHGSLGASLGLVLGGWGFGELGSGNTPTTLVLGSMVGVLIGIRWSLAPRVTMERRAATERRARAAVFLAPALGFIAIALVIPSLRTIYLSLLDRKGKKYVGFSNYVSIFREPKSWDASRIGDLWSSRLTLAAFVCFALFVVLAVRSRRRTGHTVEFGGSSMMPLVLAVVFAGFAVFTTLRGTLANNLWWVFVVTTFATTLGLTIAVLADGVKFERIAKAIIFMPLAVSMVGASVIWRLVYISRDASKPQSGTLNALWVGLGSLSTGDGAARAAFGVLPILVSASALLVLTQRLVRRDWARSALPGAIAGFGIWFSLRYWQVVGTGIGGHRFNKSGEIIADPINFLQEPPFNNFWLMIVMVWIETGFAMVIFAAAIRAVPSELTEAALVDGASKQQIFWRITLPQIAPTIGVVATTLMVLVMKVFDIAKVMTNGNFGTEVLANNMYREAFYNLNIGLGAALAVLIFVSVLPIMFVNIRRMTRTT